MRNSPAIETEKLSKQFKLAAFRGAHNTLRDQLAASVQTILSRNRSASRQNEIFWALRDISFEIPEGQAVGIIGRNGAGKSTLLKVLSRITEPSSGKAKIRGRLGSLLEVGTGFHHELTGRENLYLSGAILGMSRAELERKFDAIVAFAEVEKFLDTPVKHYSSGMFVRLAFAVAAHLDPDILLIDEVLSVGDLQFQTKCIEHTKKLLLSGATVLFVSHNMFSIKNMCERVIYLSEGQVAFDGSVEEGIDLYEKENQLAVAPWAQFELNNGSNQEAIRITEIELLDEHSKACRIFDHGDPMRVRLRYQVIGEIKNPNFSISIFRSDNVACCNFNAAMDGLTIPSLSGTGSIDVVIPALKVVAGLYSIQVIVRSARSAELYTAQLGSSFHVKHHTLDYHYGVYHDSAEWRWLADGWSLPQAKRAEALEES